MDMLARPVAMTRLLLSAPWPVLAAMLWVLAPASVFAASPDEEGPCAQPSVETREAEELLGAVTRAQRELAEGASTEAFVKALGDLRDHRCFSWPYRNWPDVKTADPIQLREWWSAGGERWLRSFLQYGAHHRKVVLAPDVRQRLAAEHRRLLARDVCTSDGASCAAGDAWRVRATAALKAARAACRDEPKPCDVPTASSDMDFFDWLVCVEDRLARSVELPLDRINPPTQGWLVVRHRRGEGQAASCRIASAYSLATGETWSIDSCESQSRVGRVPVVPLRELALLLVVGDGLDHDVRASAVDLEVPKGLEPRWEGVIGCVIGGMIGCHAVEAYHPVVSWRVSLEGGERFGTYEPEACDALSRAVDQQLRQLDRQRVEDCPTAAVPARLFAKSDSTGPRFWEPEDRERKTYEQLETLMRSTAAGCAEGSKNSP